MRSSILCLTAALLAACGPAGLDPADAHGHVTADTTWSGEVHLTGDVIVEAGAVLTLSPGTVVVVSANTDKEALSHLGPHDELTQQDPTYTDAWEQSHVTLLVNGELRAEGTAAAPIVFRSSSPTPAATDWVGLTLHRATLRFVQVEFSRDGIGTMDGHEGLVLQQSTVRHAWASCVNVQRPASGAASRIEDSTIEDCGHEAIDTHAPGTLVIARNLIRQSQAGPNLNGAMQAELRNNLILDTAVPIFVNTAEGSVFATQNVLEARLQDTARWALGSYQHPRLEPTASLTVAAEATADVVLTNSILLDGSFGVRSLRQAPVGNGYLDVFGATTAFDGSAVQGSGVVSVDPGFVDRAGGDFHLRGDSPLKGQGNPEDGQPDLGAWGGSPAPASIGAP